MLLKDLFEVARSRVIIMRGSTPVLTFNHNFSITEYLSNDILNTQINYMSVDHDNLKVWLEYEEDKNT